MLYVKISFLFACCVFCYVTIRTNAGNMAFNARKNQYFESPPIRSETRSRIECCTLCDLDETCLATNFNRETSECELLAQQPTLEEEYVTKQNWTLYLKECSGRDWVAFNQSLYRLVDKRMDWNSAYACCLSLGADLVDIHSVEENAFVYNQAMSVGISWVWIGLTDVAQPGTLIWSSGSPLSYRAFMYGQLDRNGVSEGCIFNSGETGDVWQDQSCTYQLASVCEKSKN